MKNFSANVSLLAVALWVGGLWAIGAIAAPTLFATLPEKQLAGMLAGKMFNLMAFVGMACGLYLLIHRLASEGTRAFKQWFFWIVLLMLALVLVGHFGIQPIIQGLKVQGGAAIVMEGITADRFARWHGVASVLYVVQSLLGLVLVVKQR